MLKAKIMRVTALMLCCMLFLTACKKKPSQPTEPVAIESGSTEQVTEPNTETDEKSLEDLIRERNYPATIALLRNQTTPKEEALFDKLCSIINGDFIIAGDHYIAAVNEDGSVLVAYADGYELKEVLNTQWNNVRQLIGASSFPCAVNKEGIILVPDGERPEDYEAFIEREIEAGATIGATTGNKPESARAILSMKNIRNAQGDYPEQMLGTFTDGTICQVGLDMVWDDANIEELTSWTDIIDVKTYAYNKAIALDRNGYVHTVNEVNLDWKNVVAVEVSQNAAFALTEDGHVLSSNPSIPTDAMTDIIAITGVLNVVVGLRADGTVIDHMGNQIEGLEDVVAIDYSPQGFIIGLKADGTLCISGRIDGVLQEKVLSWTGLYVPEEPATGAEEDNGFAYSEMDAEKKEWLLSEYCVDLTGDEVPERITFSGYSVAKEDFYDEIWQNETLTVEIHDGQDDSVLYERSFARVHAGNGNLAVVEYNGKTCLLTYGNPVYQGIGVFGYRIEELLPTGEQLLYENQAEHALAGMPDEWFTGEWQEKILEVAKELDAFLQTDTTKVLVCATFNGSNYFYRPGTELRINAFNVFAQEVDCGNAKNFEEYFAVFESITDKSIY